MGDIEGDIRIRHGREKRDLTWGHRRRHKGIWAGDMGT